MPSRLSIVAINMIKLTPIKAKATRLTADRVRKMVKSAYEDAADNTLRDLTEVTATWSTKPAFERKQTPDGGVEITTDDERFGWINEGTEGPYPIVARNAPRLRFQSQYTAKTTPGNIASRSGGASGPVVYAKRVIHPGIQARKWTKIIAERRNKLLKKEIDDGLKELA